MRSKLVEDFAQLVTFFHLRTGVSDVSPRNAKGAFSPCREDCQRSVDAGDVRPTLRTVREITGNDPCCCCDLQPPTRWTSRILPESEHDEIRCL